MFNQDLIETLETLLFNMGDKKTGHKEIDKNFKEFYQYYDAPQVLKGWDFRTHKIMEAKENNMMYHADLDTPYSTCHHRCKYCFVGQGDLDPRFKDLKPLEVHEWANLVRELSEEGVKSVKIVGAGETLLDSRLFQLLEILQEADIVPVIFTSGDIIGDDEFSQRVHNINGDQLVDRILDLGASFMIKFDSPISSIQDELVNTKKYSEKRNNAIKKNLRNKKIRENPEDGVRMGLETNLGGHNIKDIFHMYALRKLLGVYVDVCLTMDCNKFKKNGSKLTGITQEDVENVYFGIYYMNKILEIPYEGISPYIGGVLCSQVSLSNIYVNYGGEIFFSCCGNDERIGNFRQNNISDIRRISEKISLKKYGHLDIMHGCPFREEAGIIHDGLYEKVEQNLKFICPN